MAFAAGVDQLLVKRHGNWKSDVVFHYVTNSLEALLSVSDAVLNYDASYEDHFIDLQ